MHLSGTEGSMQVDNIILQDVQFGSCQFSHFLPKGQPLYNFPVLLWRSLMWKTFSIEVTTFPWTKMCMIHIKNFQTILSDFSTVFFISRIKLHKGRKSPLKAVQWLFNFYLQTDKFSCYVPTSLISSLYCTCKYNNVENVFMTEGEEKRNFTQDLFAFCWPGKKFL